MCPCTPVSIAAPSGPSGPSIPGFGNPFAGLIPNLNPFPPGFPEDLLALLDKLKLLIPPGALLPQLNPNFGKDIFDAIMKLLDQFMPFLMLYKFFLPILNIIICIIEVLCAIPNPFKLVSAITRLFTVCIPDFLNLFPIFALIIMIISLLLLLLALILYIIEQILKFILAILRNIAMLVDAFQEGSAISVLAIAQKLGALLCIFQNLFVLLAIFAIIIQIIKDILSLAFAIPPCDDGNGSDAGCCTTDVCPQIVKNKYTRTTGTFKYLNSVAASNPIAGLPPPFDMLIIGIRQESWQLYDSSQNIAEAFRNIVDGYDVPIDITAPPPFFKPTFFPTDGYVNNTTTAKQAPYTVDLRMFYNPSSWGRSGAPRYIRFIDCIMLKRPSLYVTNYDNGTTDFYNGVVSLGGGLGYEDDGTTPLKAFGTDGTTEISPQATLDNFIHKMNNSSSEPILLPTDGYSFENMEYTFKPNIAPLIGANLVTLGCAPDFALNKNFINAVYAGDVALKTKLLGDLVNGANGNIFPDPNACQQCLAVALDALRVNMTTQGVAEFQTTALLCLKKLQDDTNSALGSMVGLGFDPCKSSFTATPTTQFTSKPIVVAVDLKERNGISIAQGLSSTVAENIAARLKLHATFGDTTKFLYDGYGIFNANLSSSKPGSGTMMVSFDNNTFCKNVNVPPSHTLQEVAYKFVYTPVGLSIPVAPTAEGDLSDGTQPRRDEGDQSRDSGSGSS
jgi:hypothetical protein